MFKLKEKDREVQNTRRKERIRRHAESDQKGDMNKGEG